MEIFNSFRASALAAFLGACRLEHPAAGPTMDGGMDASSDLAPDVKPPAEDAPKDVFVKMDGGTDTPSTDTEDAGTTDVSVVDDGPVTEDDGMVDVFMDTADASPRDVADTPSPDTMPSTDGPIADVSDVADTRTVTTRPGTPQCLLHFDEPSGPVLSSDPSRTFGELVGGASRTAESRFGSTGTGVSFSNLEGGDAVRATDSSFGNFGTGDFGLAAWFRFRSGATSIRNLFSKRSVFALRVDTTGTIRFGSLDCNFPSTITISGTNHHVAVIRRSGRMMIIVDGMPASSESACTGNLTGANNLYIGCSETSGTSCNLPLVGGVDQVYVWTGSDTTLEGVRRLICADQREAGVPLSSFCP